MTKREDFWCCMFFVLFPLAAGILYIIDYNYLIGGSFLIVGFFFGLVFITVTFLSSPKAKKKFKLRRKHIETRVKQEVWRRDQGRCVECSSKEKLEYDHIIPLSKGGSNTARNIQLLCQKCNRSKSNKIK